MGAANRHQTQNWQSPNKTNLCSPLLPSTFSSLFFQFQIHITPTSGELFCPFHYSTNNFNFNSIRSNPYRFNELVDSTPSGFLGNKKIARKPEPNLYIDMILSTLNISFYSFILSFSKRSQTNKED